MGAAMIHKHFLASHAALNQMGAVIFYAYTFSLLRQSEEGRGFIQPHIVSFLHLCQPCPRRISVL